MNYSNIYFGKEREELEWRDIETFFNTEQDENDSIEFKSFVARGEMNEKYDGLCKSICAFLNSNGGILIWGAPVGRIIEGRKEKIFQGDLAPLNQILEKDTLIRTVSSRIGPLPKGINVKIIINGTNCICVFEIQKSITAHQIGGTYYMRIDGQSIPAPHHYVEALIKQIRFPDLSGHIKFINFVQNGLSYNLSMRVIIFNWSPLQNEKNISFRLTTSKGTFAEYNSLTTHNYDLAGKQLINTEMASVLHYGGPTMQFCSINVTPQDLRENDRMTLMLHFGGESSPMKQSKYELNLRLLNLRESPNALIEELSENVLMSDLGERSGMSREDKLRIFLER